MNTRNTHPAPAPERRQMPYTRPDGSRQALRARIRAATTARPATAASDTAPHPAPARRSARLLPARRPRAALVQWWAGAAATLALLVGVWSGIRPAMSRAERQAAAEERELEALQRRFDEMLATASPETLREAAAAYYDAIFYNPTH